MSETPKTPQGSEEVDFSQTYIEDLGLNWKKLRGKRVLDLGAGQADFALGAKKRGIEVISLDQEFGGNYPDKKLPQGVPYIVANMLDGIPLPDEDVDLIVSRAGLPEMTPEELEKLINETKRVLKPGGEFRFGPGWIHIRALKDNEWEKWQTLQEKVHNNKILTQEETSWRTKVNYGMNKKKERWTNFNAYIS
jgi:ubiquinone/menaquinone biosynthesis C-methylase UbiE